MAYANGSSSFSSLVLQWPYSTTLQLSRLTIFYIGLAFSLHWKILYMAISNTINATSVCDLGGPLVLPAQTKHFMCRLTIDHTLWSLQITCELLTWSSAI